jgi:hypothetical protein
MTGSEIGPIIVGGAKAVSAAKEALSEDATIKSELAKQAATSDHFGAAAEIRAKRVLFREVVMTKFMNPLAQLAGLGSDYFQVVFPEQLAEKVSRIPEEHVQEPKPYIVVPAVENLKNVTEEESLRDLYLNLIATAMDDRNSDSDSHPSFVKVVSQLGAEEARILSMFIRRDTVDATAVLQQHFDGEDGQSKGHLPISGYLWGMVKEDDDYYAFPGMSLYLTNWARLGLITIDMASSLTLEESYDWVQRTDEYKAAKDLYGDAVKFNKGAWWLTDYARSFGKAAGIQPGSKPGQDMTEDEPVTGAQSGQTWTLPG